MIYVTYTWGRLPCVGVCVEVVFLISTVLGYVDLATKCPNQGLRYLNMMYGTNITKKLYSIQFTFLLIFLNILVHFIQILVLHDGINFKASNDHMGIKNCRNLVVALMPSVGEPKEEKRGKEEMREKWMLKESKGDEENIGRNYMFHRELT